MSHLCWSLVQSASEESEVVQEEELPDLPGQCWVGHGGQRAGNSCQLPQLVTAADMI